MATHIDFKGQSTQYIYQDTQDQGGRLAEEWRFTGTIDSTPDEKTVYAYDNFGRQFQTAEFTLVNNVLTQTRLETTAFDPITSNISSITTPEGTINYAYDPTSGRKVRTWTAHTDTLLTYDKLGRVISTVALKLNDVVYGTFTGIDPLSGNPTFADNASNATPSPTTSNVYDLSGNIQAMTLANGLVTTHGFDSQNRLTSTTTKNGATTVFGQTLILRKDGMRTQATETRAGTTDTTTFSWQYDANGRLTREVREINNASFGAYTDYTHTFGFDLAGNRITKKNEVPYGGSETTTSMYNARNQLTTETSDYYGDTAAFTYDANGTTIAQTDANGAIKRFVADLRNRLIGLDANGDGDRTDVGDATFEYDYAGVRVKKSSVGGPTVSYLQDKFNSTGYSQVLEELSGNALVRSYMIGLDVIAQADGSLVRSFIYDAGGSVRGLVDGTGQPVTTEIYDYDAFGNRIDQQNPVQTISQLLYRGELFDTTLGQYMLRARYYNPTIGRFSSQDPTIFGAGNTRDGNLYPYGAGNPVMFNDPSGLMALSITDVQLATGVMMLLVATAITSTVLSSPGAVSAIGQSIRDANERIDQFIDWIGASASGAVSEVGIMMMLGGAAIQTAINAAKNAAIAARRLVRNAPIRLFPVFRRYGPAVYTHISTAQLANPVWMVLIYNGPNSPVTNANRNAATGTLAPAGIVGGVTMEWDEYPFASTAQGGAGASVVQVPQVQNRVQGGLLSAFYRIGLRGKAISFLVVPIPL
jgi:RHS repeat-associated protein